MPRSPPALATAPAAAALALAASALTALASAAIAALATATPAADLATADLATADLATADLATAAPASAAHAAVAPAPATLIIVASTTDAGWARAVPNVVHCCALGEVTADGGRGACRRDIAAQLKCMILLSVGSIG